MTIRYILAYTFMLSMLAVTHTHAQIGGDNVYEFLNLAPSARVTALGGSLITVYDDDVALAYDNPAALNEQMHQHLSFNYRFLLAGIGNGFVNYGHHVSKWNTTIHGGVQYINYGDFNATDELGNVTGSFGATEYAFTVGAGRRLYERMTVGANLKMVSSQLESFQSVGLAADAAVLFQDTASRFTASLVFRNIGGQFSTYYEGAAKEPIPFDLQMGVSKRLKHLPFRLSVIAHNLHRWNILYDDPNQEQTTIFTGEQVSENELGMWVDNLFRHLIFNGEFLLGKRENLRLRVGYNHLLRQELSVSGLRSMAGFSFGFGLKIKRFRIDYGQQIQHLAGSANHLSISTHFGEFRSKRHIR